MTWVFQFDEEQRLVLVKANGALQTAPLRQMTEELRDAVRQHDSKAVLLDYTETTLHLQPYEIFERPKTLTEVGFPADVKVAVVFRALDENTQFLENVYRNKNYPVRVFAEKAAALIWLAEKP